MASASLEGGEAKTEEKIEEVTINKKSRLNR